MKNMKTYVVRVWCRDYLDDEPYAYTWNIYATNTLHMEVIIQHKVIALNPHEDYPDIRKVDVISVYDWDTPTMNKVSAS